MVLIHLCLSGLLWFPLAWGQIWGCKRNLWSGGRRSGPCGTRCYTLWAEGTSGVRTSSAPFSYTCKTRHAHCPFYSGLGWACEVSSIGHKETGLFQEEKWRGVCKWQMVQAGPSSNKAPPRLGFRVLCRDTGNYKRHLNNEKCLYAF